MALPTASDNLFPKVIIRESADDGSDFSNPTADYRVLFLGEDGDLHLKDSSGTVTDVGGGSSDLAGKELDYAQITSDASITATSGATANTVITGASVAYDGSTVILIEFFTDALTPDTGSAGRLIDVVLYDGSTELGILARARQNGSGSVFTVPGYGARRLTPSNASHTYSIRAYVSAGTGTVAGGSGAAGNHMPAFMRITRVTS